MTDYTPKPGDLVQLKSGKTVMTAVPYTDNDHAGEVFCCYDCDGHIEARVLPTVVLMPAKVDNEPGHDVMQARVDALREALRDIIRCTDETFNSNTIADEALRADDLLNDEETEES